MYSEFTDSRDCMSEINGNNNKIQIVKISIPVIIVRKTHDFLYYQTDDEQRFVGQSEK